MTLESNEQAHANEKAEVSKFKLKYDNDVIHCSYKKEPAFFFRILAILSTLAIPAVPSSSVICVIIILSSVNVTSSNIGIIMSLEWLQ